MAELRVWWTFVSRVASGGLRPRRCEGGRDCRAKRAWRGHRLPRRGESDLRRKGATRFAVDEYELGRVPPDFAGPRTPRCKEHIIGRVDHTRFASGDSLARQGPRDFRRGRALAYGAPAGRGVAKARRPRPEPICIRAMRIRYERAAGVCDKGRGGGGRRHGQPRKRRTCSMPAGRDEDGHQPTAAPWREEARDAKGATPAATEPGRRGAVEQGVAAAASRWRASLMAS